MDSKKRSERAPRIRKRPGQYHHGDLKEALVLAAEQLVARTASVDVSLREVAAAAGVTHAAAYRHFENKNDLLAELARRGFVSLEAILNEALTHGQEEDQLVDLGAAYIAFATSSPGLFRVMFHPSLKPFAKHPELMRAAAQALGVLRELLARRNTSEATEAELRLRTIAAWACVHGPAVLLLDQQLGGPFGVEPEQAEEVARSVLRTLARGLGSQRPNGRERIAMRKP